MGGMFTGCCGCADLGTLQGKFVTSSRPWYSFVTEFDVAAVTDWAADAGNAGLHPIAIHKSSGHVDTRYRSARRIIEGVGGGTLYALLDGYYYSERDQDNGETDNGQVWDDTSFWPTFYRTTFFAGFGEGSGHPDYCTVTRVFTSITTTEIAVTWTAVYLNRDNDGNVVTEGTGTMTQVVTETLVLEDAVTLAEQADRAEAEVAAIVAAGEVEGYVGGVLKTIAVVYPSEWGTDNTSGLVVKPRGGSFPWDGTLDVGLVDQTTTGPGATQPAFLSLTHPDYGWQFWFPAWVKGLPEPIAGGFNPTLVNDGARGLWRMPLIEEEGVDRVFVLHSVWNLPDGYGCGDTPNNGVMVNHLTAATGEIESPTCEPETLSPGEFVFTPSGLGIAWHHDLPAISRPYLQTGDTVPDCCP